MKTKEFGLSIVLNAFLGYLWILFIEHIVSIANSMDNVFIVGGIVIIIGTTLFMEIVKRVTPKKGIGIYSHQNDSHFDDYFL